MKRTIGVIISPQNPSIPTSWRASTLYFTTIFSCAVFWAASNIYPINKTMNSIGIKEVLSFLWIGSSSYDSIFPIIYNPMNMTIIDIQCCALSLLFRNVIDIIAVIRIVPPFNIYWVLAFIIVKVTFNRPTTKMSMKAGIAKTYSGAFGKNVLS